MEQYKLTVSGVDGSRAATVSFNNEIIDTFEVKDVKDAQKKARAVALKHRDDNRPASIETYTHHFSV